VDANARCLELLKPGGLSFSQAEIVNELGQKFECAKRAVVETEGVRKWRRIVKQEWRKRC
jgi:hypothetical protein